MRRRGHEDVASKDVYLNGFALVAVVAYLLLMIINPISKDETTKPPGNLVAEIGWPDDDPSDIDLWSLPPGEERPVGFSNRTGLIISLLRDDLGKRNDTLPQNAEHAYAREVRAGRYTFNVVCYVCRTGPVTVGFEVRVIMNGVPRTLLSTTVTLTATGQEVTVVEFTLDKDANIVPGSSHNVFRPLWKNWGAAS